MRALSHELAAILASRLHEGAPGGFSVRADGEQIGVFAGSKLVGGSAASGIVDDDDNRPLAEKIETAVFAVLDATQDCIAEELTMPWPRVPGERMITPIVRREGARLRFWYGDEDTAVLEFRPIDLGKFTKAS